VIGVVLVIADFYIHGMRRLATKFNTSNTFKEIKGPFTLWPKVERPLISTNHIARNQEFGLSTLHTRG
jgi:hypothetical protein